MHARMSFTYLGMGVWNCEMGWKELVSEMKRLMAEAAIGSI
jgi:hypothetical protein